MPSSSAELPAQSTLLHLPPPSGLNILPAPRLSFGTSLKLGFQPPPPVLRTHPAPPMSATITVPPPATASALQPPAFAPALQVPPPAVGTSTSSVQKFLQPLPRLIAPFQLSGGCAPASGVVVPQLGSTRSPPLLSLTPAAPVAPQLLPAPAVVAPAMKSSSKLNSTALLTSTQLTSTQEQQAFVGDIKTSSEQNVVEKSRIVYSKTLPDKLMAMAIRFDGDFTVSGFDGVDRPLHLRSLAPTDGGETGLRVWDAGIVLAKYFEENARRYSDKHILELGAGTGISGLGAALLPNNRVILTDKPDARIREQTEQNIQLNRSTIEEANSSCKFYPLDWNKTETAEDLTTQIPREELRKTDLIIASDVVWAHPFVKPFLTTLKRLCDFLVDETMSSAGTTGGAANGLEILFSHKERDPSVEEAFLKALPEYKFRVAEKLLSGGLGENHANYSAKVRIYRLEYVESWYER
eukprot:CAMPEP_0179000324 /NCGR_PEP_ID=MMETSP0795-20121207/10598_1 /TAXON_ID=88552 /ORGANISM="Amoebophrya sp., Strain Ameob2" /LENGTH=465 /DNA_ID=CAMNT_0020693287 /DNA_START=46 /DNA_END=1443 /DNA_ORIENTATION=-